MPQIAKTLRQKMTLPALLVLPACLGVTNWTCKLFTHLCRSLDKHLSGSAFWGMISSFVWLTLGNCRHTCCFMLSLSMLKTYWEEVLAIRRNALFLSHDQTFIKGPWCTPAWLGCTCHHHQHHYFLIMLIDYELLLFRNESLNEVLS